MGSAGNETPLVHNEDLVRIHHRRNTLRDDELGHMGQLRPEGPADCRVRGGIHSACGIVQNHDLRLFQEGAGDADPLFLTAGQIAAALPDLRFIAIRKGSDKAVRLGDPAGLHKRLIGRLLISPPQIFRNDS